MKNRKFKTRSDTRMLIDLINGKISLLGSQQAILSEFINNKIIKNNEIKNKKIKNNEITKK